MRVLYLSYDGLTDPLGRSQILPYLKGLARKGYDITILSFEKKRPFEQKRQEVGELCKADGLEWHPLSYTKFPPVLSTLWDIWRCKREVARLHSQSPFHALHCRSYIPALIGLSMKQKDRTGFIFDMRGFWPDERVEGRLWNLKNPIHRLIYRYFKRKEKAFLRSADLTISLTQAGKDEIRTRFSDASSVDVIPCATDMELFDPARITPEDQESYRRSLQLSEEDLILSYLGSIGTWYLLSEMLDLFKVLLNRRPTAKFLFITTAEKEVILEEAEKKAIPKDAIRITEGDRTEIPVLLSLSDASLCFYAPLFSKKGTSPTKMGEAMSLGLPVIGNAGIGDVEAILKKIHSGLVVKAFHENEYEKALDAMDAVLQNTPSFQIREKAGEIFDLETAIRRYGNVYEKVRMNQANVRG